MHETFEKAKWHVAEGGGDNYADLKMFEDSKGRLSLPVESHKVASFTKDGQLMIPELDFGTSLKAKSEAASKSSLYGDPHNTVEKAGGFGGGAKGRFGLSGESHLVETHPLGESHKVKTHPVGSHVAETHPIIKSKKVETHPIERHMVETYPVIRT